MSSTEVKKVRKEGLIASGVLGALVLSTFIGLDQRKRNLNFTQKVSTEQTEKDYGVQISAEVQQGDFHLLSFTSAQGEKFIIRIYNRGSRSGRGSIPVAHNSIGVELDFDPGETITLNAQEIGFGSVNSRVGTIEYFDRTKQGNKPVGVFFF